MKKNSLDLAYARKLASKMDDIAMYHIAVRDERELRSEEGKHDKHAKIAGSFASEATTAAAYLRLLTERVEELTGIDHIEVLTRDIIDLQVGDYVVTRRADDLFAVKDDSSKVFHELEDKFVHEPTPSSRNEDFIRETRFPLREAIEIAKAWSKKKTGETQ